MKARRQARAHRDKPLSHTIGIEAVKIFKAALPEDGWTTYDITPDYRKDNKVELVEDGSHTGTCFWVQIKGQQKVKKLRDGTVSFGLETADLDYFIKLKVPLFLFVIDVTARTGNWIFVQEYERIMLRDSDWWEHDEVQIHLPPANSLADLDHLRRVVVGSMKFMADKEFRRGAFEEKRRMESIDPRCEVQVTDGTNGRHYHVQGKENIPFDIVPREGASTSRRIEELLNSGKPLLFQKSEIEIQGIPLLNELLEMAGATAFHLQVTRSVAATARIARNDSEGRMQGSIEALPCNINFGINLIKIDGILLENLLGFSMEVPLPASGQNPISFRIDFSSWKGRQLMDLPAFDALYKTMGLLEETDQLSLEIYIPGQQIFNGMLTRGNEPFLSVVSFLLDVLNKARTIATFKGINPTIPDEFGSRASVLEILWLYDVLIGDGYEQSWKDRKVGMTVQFEKIAFRAFLDGLSKEKNKGTLLMSSGADLPFLGDLIHLDQVFRHVSDVKLLNNISDIRNELRKHPSKKSYKLNWCGTGSSLMITTCKSKWATSDVSSV